MLCRVCRNELGDSIYASSAPAITSLATTLDAPTKVYVCPECGHSQSDDLPSLDAFYDTDYKISLASDDHDQVYEVRDGKSVFRTDRQAEVAINLLGMHPAAKILRKIIAQRPNASPHVFDVSEDYRPYWASWLPHDACATYQVPSNWRGRFDVVTAHYVIEHVSSPIAVLAELRGLLAPGGKLFFSVPDWTQNTGDLLVVDHVNHFSETSVRAAAWHAGLAVDLLASDQLPGAFVAICSPSKSPSAPPTEKVKDEVEDARAACSFWEAAVTALDNACESRRDRPSAIFGVGFYGSLVHSRVGKKLPISCFLDNNPHSWSLRHFGLPVRPPAEMPDDVRTVFVGLNPSKARAIVAQTPTLNRDNIELVFFGDTD
jgi:SAM-dependent methyltransferase